MTFTYRTRGSRLSVSRRAKRVSVEATGGLPDLESLPLHKYRTGAKYGDILIHLTYNPPRVNPRECDYVVDPADWTAANRNGDHMPEDEDDRGAPQGCDTVESILGADIDDMQCEVCDEVGHDCHGAACIPVFKAQLAAQESRYLEIRHAGAMGLGIFAKRAIPKGTLLCEYTGRLMPIDFTHPPADPSYTWHVAGTCRVDSLVYGNIGRFANHHCLRYNCDAIDVMYGRRKVLCYNTRCDIPEGTQVFVNYGHQYFTAEKPCLCTAADEAHLLGAYNMIKVVPTKKSAMAALKKLAAEKEKERQLERSRSRSRSPVTRSAANKLKVTKAARVVIRSRL